jgi:sigma-B regulation protein RsbU (phosphoserine phosphatase)
MRRYFLDSLPGRVIIAGAAIRVLVTLVTMSVGSVPRFLAVIDLIAGLAIAVGLGYFVIRLIIVAKRRLLWRVRRKLILSYVFVGFVPALLIVGFFLLCGFLLFYNFSSYLVQSRLRVIAERARFVGHTTALEIQRGSARDAVAILTRRQAKAAQDYPGISMTIVPGRRTCESDVAPEMRQQPSDFRAASAGPWEHVAPPATIPDWIGCEGFAGVLAYSHTDGTSDRELESHLLVRSVSFPEASNPPYAVVVDIVVNDRVRQQLQNDTGVELKSMTAVAGEAHPMVARDTRETQPAGPPGGGIFSRQLRMLDYRDWSTGVPGTVVVVTGLSIADLYNRISAVEGSLGQRFGTGLLLFLVAIGALFFIIELMAAIAGFSLARSITGSVHELFMGTERVRQGDFTHKIAVHSDDQLGELAVSFNQMTASIEDLLLQAAEKKRLEEELRIAHEIQMSLLPQGPLVMPGLSVTAVCVPAREVGGDYYDFLPLDDHRVGVLIADVSGKGTSAALYMAELKGLVLSLCRIHASPRDLLIDANRIIAEHLDARSFITMTYAIIDLRARTMTYARAGHTPLIHVPGPGVDSRRARILAPDGLVLGLKIDHGEMFERLLQEDTIPLHEGDLYLFFTDGISEAMNAHDDCFGEGRLGLLLETHANLRSDELRERVLREIAAFVGDAPQHDDMTMILLKVEETRKPEVRSQKEEEVRSVASAV